MERVGGPRPRAGPWIFFYLFNTFLHLISAIFSIFILQVIYVRIVILSNFPIIFLNNPGPTGNPLGGDRNMQSHPLSPTPLSLLLPLSCLVVV